LVLGVAEGNGVVLNVVLSISENQKDSADGSVGAGDESSSGVDVVEG